MRHNLWSFFPGSASVNPAPVKHNHQDQLAGEIPPRNWGNQVQPCCISLNSRSTHTHQSEISLEVKIKLCLPPPPPRLMQFNITVQRMEVIMGCLCIMVSGLDHRYSSPTHRQHTHAHAEKLPSAYIIQCVNKVRSLPTLPRLGTLSGFSLSQTECFKHVKSFPSSLPKPSLSKTIPILTL